MGVKTDQLCATVSVLPGTLPSGHLVTHPRSTYRDINLK